jgi:FtsP/CotA-like multicopper oxidase with cupredoxin domain/plastocyanin
MYLKRIVKYSRNLNNKELVMTIIEYWIQLENRPWDVCPRGRDRMTGLAIRDIPGELPPVNVVLSSPSGVTRTVSMNRPHSRNNDGSAKDALILRRYTANWKNPDDRKVNPWDINEPDPTEGNIFKGGTMGTIPGPVLECSIGDTIIVHFKNMDDRRDLTGDPTSVFLQKTHSLHTHGITFSNKHDGAYPLSPADDSDDPQNPGTKLNQITTAAEANLWAGVPGFTGNFKQGDRVPPTGTFTYVWNTLGWPTTAGMWLYHDHSICDMDNVNNGAIGALVIHNRNDVQDVDIRRGPDDPDPAFLPGGSPNGSPVINGKYVTPSKALYIQLYHDFGNAGMCINGRKYLGNTPTPVAGPNTLMRFGIIGMGMGSDAHTFHIHGHRWIVPGPHGTDPASIQNSRMDTPVSQFEDTRIFGQANSFIFTIQEGNSTFMGAPDPVGEWHMHCHVLAHMMGGMMGSLLVVNDNQDFLPLPTGVPCPSMPMHTSPATITVNNNNFTAPDGTNTLTVSSGTEVTFNFATPLHTVVFDSPTNADRPTNINNGGGDTDAISPIPQQKRRTITGNPGGEIPFHCGIHLFDGIIRIGTHM